jgi:hypothetical protein
MSLLHGATLAWSSRATPKDSQSLTRISDPSKMRRSRSSSRHSVKPALSVIWPGDCDPYQIQAAKGWHVVGETGNWDVKALVRDLRESLIHSQHGRRSAGGALLNKWRFAAFEPKPNLIIGLEHEDGVEQVLLRVWADSPKRAQAEFVRLHKQYFRQPDVVPANEADYSVISVRMGAPYLRKVRVTPNIRRAADLVLHYGEAFLEWHRRFCDQLKERKSGVTLLQGPPGTGKTTYLRHLLFELKETHQFYYLPLTSYSMLCSPDCIDFWLNENRQKSGKVVVIEDAESLLAKRGSDNQQALSNLLNISDGFSGDYLKLHLICTISGPIKDLDPAVTRPGRLIGSREFPRLTRAQAERLAETLGIRLEPLESYSLADIYNKTGLLQCGEAPRKVGFAT